MKKILAINVPIDKNDVITARCDYDTAEYQAEFANEIHYRKTTPTLGTGHGGIKEEFWLVCPDCERVLPIPQNQWDIARKYMANVTVVPQDWHG
jgi:hypothetical protein